MCKKLLYSYYKYFFSEISRIYYQITIKSKTFNSTMARDTKNREPSQMFRVILLSNYAQKLIEDTRRGSRSGII